ncbi:MAG: hypothetical protein MI807_03935 [Verrucomicrobiales bacterium]|nr:hypothetical protein [Verrucomicrobiales bacterium]
MSVSIQQAKALLDCDELSAVEAPVADATGLQILPADFATPYQNALNRAEISSDQALEILRVDREQLIRFCVGIQEASKDDDLDGDFPPGYEVDDEEESDEVEVHGIGNGFGLTQMCWWKFAKDGDRSGLQAFLKWQRIPGLRKFTSDLLSLAETTKG